MNQLLIHQYYCPLATFTHVFFHKKCSTSKFSHISISCCCFIFVGWYTGIDKTSMSIYNIWIDWCTTSSYTALLLSFISTRNLYMEITYKKCSTSSHTAAFLVLVSYCLVDSKTTMPAHHNRSRSTSVIYQYCRPSTFTYNNLYIHKFTRRAQIIRTSPADLK